MERFLFWLKKWLQAELKRRKSELSWNMENFEMSFRFFEPSDYSLMFKASRKQYWFQPDGATCPLNHTGQGLDERKV